MTNAADSEQLVIGTWSLVILAPATRC